KPPAPLAITRCRPPLTSRADGPNRRLHGPSADLQNPRCPSPDRLGRAHGRARCRTDTAAKAAAASTAPTSSGPASSTVAVAQERDPPMRSNELRFLWAIHGPALVSARAGGARPQPPGAPAPWVPRQGANALNSPTP